ncbi:unnamed protein product [Rangifer tarandus platyrhynchus]|uniref:Uncharacterized protein n=1 Tax=Rangifer tarandus platyrhynchus TaxID=3082113 RepID=A0ABN8ZGX3_RANTA|nr:unnamed protein product [Rangifer tarandus platyrhynchus]
MFLRTESTREDKSAGASKEPGDHTRGAASFSFKTSPGLISPSFTLSRGYPPTLLLNAPPPPRLLWAFLFSQRRRGRKSAELGIIVAAEVSTALGAAAGMR